MSKNNLNDNQSPIYTIKLELNNEIEEDLYIYKDTNPVELGSIIKKKYILSDDEEKYLVSEIERLLNEYSKSNKKGFIDNISIISEEKQSFEDEVIENNIKYFDMSRNVNEEDGDANRKMSIFERLYYDTVNRKYILLKRSQIKKEKEEKEERKEKVKNILQKQEKSFEEKYRILESKKNEYNPMSNYKNDEINNNNTKTLDLVNNINSRNIVYINKSNSHNSFNNNILNKNYNNHIQFKFKTKPVEEDEKNVDTFKYQPNISIASKKIMSQIDKSQFLYKKLLKKEKIQNEIQKELTFNPKINENIMNSNSYIKKDSMYRYASILNYNKRLEVYKTISNKSKSKLNQKYNSNIDYRTKQELHKPLLISSLSSILSQQKTIQSSKMNNQKAETRSKYENVNLYLERRKKEEEEIKRKIKFDSNFNVTKNTERIYEKLKIKAFSNIFTILDTDNDDYIDEFNINLDGICENILKIIYPIVGKVLEQKENYNQIEFCLAMNQLFDMISIDDRRFLIDKYKNNELNEGKIENEGNTFKPEINPKSKEIDEKNYQKKVDFLLSCLKNESNN